uniref:Uncharacterized protein n=1 Tax=Tanacetum cinerariifolium TaxID=118510 RepID=A0A6L2N351_TANCI|nr:hypothetical protein [Tanacetum cinerariifolium]
MLKTSNYDHDAREAIEDFKQYTHMEAQSFKDLIIQHVDSIEKLPYTAEYHVFAIETSHSEQPEHMHDTSLTKKVNCNTTPDSSDMCHNEFKDDQNADDHEDERDVLATLTENLKLDTDENKKIQKQLKQANTSLSRKLQECKSALEECKSSLEKSIDI